MPKTKTLNLVLVRVWVLKSMYRAVTQTVKLMKSDLYIITRQVRAVYAHSRIQVTLNQGNLWYPIFSATTSATASTCTSIAFSYTSRAASLSSISGGNVKSYNFSDLFSSKA